MKLKNGKVFTSKFVGTGPSSYEKRIYRAAVSQRLRNTDFERGTTVSQSKTEFIWCRKKRTEYLRSLMSSSTGET